MKRFFAGMMAVAMTASILPAAVSADGITAQKTNYIVGTSGKITGGSNYTSSADDIVSVDSDGTIKALAPGEATISSDNGSIDITVHEKAGDDFVNDIKQEYEDGKILINDAPRWGEMHNILKDSGIWAYGMNSYFGYSTGESSLNIKYDALMNDGGPWTGGQWAALIYKMPETASDSMRIQLFYDANAITAQNAADKMIYVGYRTSDYAWYTDRNNALSEMRDANKDSYSSRSYDLARIISTSVENDTQTPKLNTDVWTQIPISAEKNLKDYDASGTGDLFIETDLPSDAEYVVVMLNNGSYGDEDPSAVAYNPRRLGFRKTTINSVKSLAAGEITDDGKIALTYNGDAENPALTVKKNGNVVEANVTYDADTYTSYISGSFVAGDYVEVSSEKGYKWSGTIPGEPVVVDYDKVYFSSEKTAYVEGTTGKIDFVAVKGTETWKNNLDTTYASSNENAVKIDNKGNITAVAPGEASITMSVNSMPEKSFAPITIKVYPASVGESFVKDEIAAGKLDYKCEPRADLMSSRLHGSKLYAYMLSGEPVQGYGGVFTGTSDEAYMGFVYKLEDEVESIKIEEYLYGDYPNEVNKRTSIGYLTDDSKEFYDQGGGGPYTWKTENLNMFGVAGGITDDPRTAPIELDPIWTKIETKQDDWAIGVTDPDKRDAALTVTSIPSNAKYAVVLIKVGKLADAEKATVGDFIQYKGATINYKKKLLEGTLNEDNKAVLTFNISAKNVALNVTKNGGNVSDPTVTYSDDGYTAYIDADIKAGDRISVSTDYGDFSAEANDTREQIDSISITDASGEPVSVLLPYSENVTIKTKVKVINTDSQKLTVYAALYDVNGTLTGLANAEKAVSAMNAETEAVLTIEEVPETAVLKVFAWDDSMKPFANYKNLTTKIETAEF